MNELRQFLVGHAEAVLFLAIFAEQLGVPFPAVPILLAAGALIADGALNPATALGITIVACMLADLIWFYVGRVGGNGPLRFLCRLFLRDASSFGRTERAFAKYGMSAVVAAKFIPGLGLLVPPMAGAFRIPVGKFLKFDALGSLCYGIFYLELGFLFSHQVTSMLELISQFGVVSAALVLAPLLIFVACKYAKRRKTSTTTSEAAPAALATISGA